MVRWTVFSDSGKQVSGRRLTAIRTGVGTYYAPWLSDVPNGNYRIDWEVWEMACGSPRVFTQQIFVVDPSSYGPCGPLDPSGAPAYGKGTYLTGSTLGRGGLPLFLKGQDGLPANAFAVFWTVFNSFGNAVSQRFMAFQAASGEYYAPWRVDVNSGDYRIRWEWMESSDSPLQSSDFHFSVINPGSPYAPHVAITCGGVPLSSPCAAGPLVLASRVMFVECPPPGGGGGPQCCPSPPPAPCSVAIPAFPVMPSGACCGVEIPRVIHVPEAPLPPSGNFTGQGQYVIPRGIRRITYYVTYRRAAPGGYAIVRILWGNGVEETQSTVIDTGMSVLTSALSSQDMFLNDLTGPMPPDDNPVSFAVETSVPGGAVTARLLVAERGTPGIPGTISVALTASS